MQPDFERTMESLQRVSCIISDGFLGWTQHSATKLGIPRMVFYGMNSYAMTVSAVITLDRTFARVESDDELVTVPGFDSVRLTKNDLEYPFNDPDARGPHAEFVNEQVTSNMQSKGFLVNSVYELEAPFVDFWNKNDSPKVWCVGPLCLAEPAKALPGKRVWIEWLDEQWARGRSVLYVAFGSQAEISANQFEEIATGLERSGLSFLWIVRSKWSDSLFEERVKDRGLMVSDWVDQVEILSHESVNGFMSHCGWNSVIESICESVPILAWPMMAEQHLNARMVVEELGVGIRVLARNGSVRGFVGSECIEKMVRELMQGEKGKDVRKKMKEICKVARKAMDECSGPSWLTLDKFLEEICTQ